MVKIEGYLRKPLFPCSNFKSVNLCEFRIVISVNYFTFSNHFIDFSKWRYYLVGDAKNIIFEQFIFEWWIDGFLPVIDIFIRWFGHYISNYCDAWPSLEPPWVAEKVAHESSRHERWMGPSQVPAFTDVCDWFYPDPEIESLKSDGSVKGHFYLEEWV